MPFMRRIVLTLCALAMFVAAGAQGRNPVAWSAPQVRALGGDLFEVVFAARIAPSWHLYDLGPYDAMGPNATVFAFPSAAGASLSGTVYQIDAPTRFHDSIFGMEIGWFADSARFAQQFKVTVPKATLHAEVTWQACDDKSCIPPATHEFSFTIENPEAAPAPADASGKHLWALIAEAILWGLAALLTPCVFPMVPMTISYFLKQQGSPRRGRWMASLYGFFIVALYTLPIAVIILVTRVVGGETVTADIFNWIATHWLPNVLFFIVFMVFAASFFGAFEIVLPSWMVNRSDRNADRGGTVGVFFMALTLVLVSFSCTGPIVGTVLLKSTAGEFWEPIATMLAFSVAFALPFVLFALFPSLLDRLPGSGGWMNSVKVVLGFLEVALGLKFLSVADQTYHWGILDREVYLAIWIVVFTLLGLYLLGKISFAHDSEVKHIGVFRLLLVIVTFSFVVYLVPGLWGAPLKGIAGYLPPLTSQDFVAGGGAPSQRDAGGRKYADFLHAPNGLDAFFELEEGLAYARKVDKPVLLDFTGHGCVNCREMDAKVLARAEVLDRLRNDYVVVVLYSDDKKEVPASDWVTTGSGRVLKGLGKINSYIAGTRFGVNAQPCYLVLDGQGRALMPARGYDLDAAAFAAFLDEGIEKYKL